MNTKSFVNQLDADNVVKGYYDESDQLVMVEPEGSGGGDGDSDFTTAKMTIVGSGALGLYLPIINITDDTIYNMTPSGAGVYDIVLYNGKYYADIDLETYDVSGNAVYDSENEMTLITGDFTLTYKGGEE